MSEWRTSRLIAALAIAGLGVLGAAAPAAAAEPVAVEFTDSCGAVGVRIIGAASAHVTFKRNGEVFATFVEALADGSNLVGVHADGDALSVQIEDGAPFTHTYSKPAECTLPAPVTFELQNACQGIALLNINNTGATAATGYQLRIGSDEPEDLGDIEPGETALPVPAESVQVVGALGRSSVLWLLMTPEIAKDCGPGTVSATFADTCDKVKVTVTSTIESPQWYWVVLNPDDEENGALVDGGFVVSGTPGMHEVPAAAGDEVAVYYPEFDEEEASALLRRAKKGTRASALEVPGLKLIGAHTHAVPSTCGGTGGGLPVTGFQAGLASGIGLLLVGGGFALYMITRRRVRFTEDQ